MSVTTNVYRAVFRENVFPRIVCESLERATLGDLFLDHESLSHFLSNVRREVNVMHYLTEMTVTSLAP